MYGTPLFSDYLIFPIRSVAVLSKIHWMLLRGEATLLTMNTPDQTITVGSVKLTLKPDGRLQIHPNRKLPGSPVVVDGKKLENWAKRLYREEVLR